MSNLEKDILERLISIDNKLSAMNNYYAQNLSKAIITKDKLEEISKTVKYKEVEVKVPKGTKKKNDKRSRKKT